jgi:N-acetyl-gamma-glutamyl-phosphate reductase
MIRLSSGELPELRACVGTPFCDVGWIVRGHSLVIGFAIDNLLKGAASQAVQNLNLLCGLPETCGLLPHNVLPQPV